MASITINDLQENFELDKDALANLLGGHGCKRWKQILGYYYTGKKKKKGHRSWKQVKVKVRKYKLCWRDYCKYKWIAC